MRSPVQSDEQDNRSESTAPLMKDGAGEGLAAQTAVSHDIPRKLLGHVDAESAAALAAAAGDVALVIDAAGLITDVACSSEDLAREGYGKWIGKPWIETVTLESRPKIEEMLQAVATTGTSRPRHVNHPSSRGPDVPVLYSAVRGGGGCSIAVGRDLRPMAMMQQRLVEAQHSMERDYWRLRQAETRYRLLFQTAPEPVLIVDGTSERVVEANPAAGELLAVPANRVAGKALQELFDASSQGAILSMLARVRTSGHSDGVPVELAEGGRSVLAAGVLYRQDKASFVMVRLSLASGENVQVAASRSRNRLLELVQNAPDAFVVTDVEGRIISANTAFVEMVQIVNEDLASGESLERWLGRPGVDLEVLLTNLRQYGNVRLFATTLRGDYGANAEVEISAVSIPDGEQPCLGFLIRNVGRRLATKGGAPQLLPRSVQQLTELVGRVPLKDIVRDTTDLLERLCIEAALELTHDNRASAAEMLGLSRQSLYVKLHRYGLGDLGSEEES